MVNNTITAVFGALRETRVRPRYRYDYGQTLICKGIPDMPDIYEAHFVNVDVDDEAVRMLGGADGVVVPDAMFRSGADILVYIYVHDMETDGETVYQVTIPVLDRARPAEADPTPEQADVIAQAIGALNSGIEAAETAAESAAASETAAAGHSDSASGYAELARSWAVGDTGSRTGEEADCAKHWAEMAMQGAEYAGYAWFDIDDSTGQMVVTTANVLGTQVRFEVDEDTGTLEVIVL